jgi:membrane protein DedA with SNARE-associated domain
VLPEFLQDHPFWLVFTALTALAMARGQATYWLARIVGDQAARLADGVRASDAIGPRRAAIAAWLHGREVSRGARALRSWGLVAIPLGYLTVGFQTLVLAAAGVVKVPWGVFTLAQLPGALAWAGIYSTIGWAVWEAALAALTGHPAGLVGLLALLLVVVSTVVINRRATTGSDQVRSSERSAKPPPRRP